MNEYTIGIAFATTIVAAIIGGRMAGERTTSINWSFAIATALGLTLLQTSEFRDLANLLQPRSAIEWLPLACLVFGIAQSAEASWRLSLSASAGIAFPLRFLWGSIYLKHHNWQAWLAITVWIAATFVLLSFSKSAEQRRLQWSVTAWGLLIAASVFAVLGGGSVIYAVAIGITGAGSFATFLATRKLPEATGVLLCALVGLSVAFSELPFLVAVLVAVAAIGLSIAPRLKSRPQRIRASVAVVTGASLSTVVIFAVMAMISTVDELGVFSNRGFYSTKEYDSDSSAVPDGQPINESLPGPFTGIP